MSGLVPFNKKNRNLVNKDFGDFGGFYNMLDDFFSDNWPSVRSLARDTFKVDVQENDTQYVIEAEVPGVNKDEVKLEMNDGRLNISIQREENRNEENKNYVHKERRYSSMSRSIYLDEAKSEGIKASLENGVLNITVPKETKPNNSIKIDID
ncbi:MAG: Hsp20/alpha crystallin family protein [Anaerotignaceae bacterium]